MSEWKCHKLYEAHLDAIFFRIPNRRGGNYPDPDADAIIRQFEECEALHPRPSKIDNLKNARLCVPDLPKDTK